MKKLAWKIYAPQSMYTEIDDAREAT